jgi:hypothetical protein
MATSASLLCSAAAAEPDRGGPRFTFAEEVVIARNDALVALLPVDPWGVRRILDALALAKRQHDGSKPSPGSGRHRDILGREAPAEGITPPDAASNPDLNLLFQRSSPEAAYDLFQILKRAGRSVAN